MRPYILLLHLQRMVLHRQFEHLDNLGLLTLAAFLEENGYRARAFTGITTDGLAVIEHEFANRKILAIGLYCDYDNQHLVEALSRRLKEEHGLPVIVGGPQTIHLGRAFLEGSGCDALVRGDGEYTLLELLDSISSGIGFDTVRGIVTLDHRGKETVTPERPLLSDLDALPLPSSTHILGRAHKYNLSVVSARGCPFRCAFCFEGGNTKALRLRSVRRVTEEIRKGLAENPDVRYIWFIDDTFTLDYDRTARFCEALTMLRAEYDFVWFCEAHARILHRYPELLPMMKAAGMARMQIGMESGWPPALGLYGKQTTIGEIEEVVRLCAKHELPQLHGNFIIGGARETIETLELTTSFAERLLDAAPGLVDISSTFVMPLPNTRITTHPNTFGLRILDPDSITSFEDFPVSETETLTRNEVSSARRKFVRRIADKRNSLFREGKIPGHRIRTHYELALRYGISSTWYKHLYEKDPIIHPYYTMLAATPARSLDEIPLHEVNSWYPCRVMDPAEMLRRPDGVWHRRDTVLSTLENDLLRLCSGKVSLGEIIGRLVQTSKKEREKIEGMALQALRDFDRRRWVVLFPP